MGIFKEVNSQEQEHQIRSENKPLTFSLDQLEEAFNSARLTHPMAGMKYDTFAEYVHIQYGIMIQQSLQERILEILIRQKMDELNPTQALSKILSEIEKEKNQNVEG